MCGPFSDMWRVDLKTKLLTVFVVLTNVLGNFFLSWGMKHQPADLGLSPLAYLRLIFSPWALLGTALLILWLLSRMTLLGWADLSYVLPVTSIGYVFTAMLGRFFLGEKITPLRWVGTSLIVIGISFVGLTRPDTTAEALP
ncbi:MAG: EamA family transporter [Bryobacteraceae bacterium]